MQNVLGRPVYRSGSGTMLMMRLARAYDESAEHGPQRSFARIATAVANIGSANGRGVGCRSPSQCTPAGRYVGFRGFGNQLRGPFADPDTWRPPWRCGQRKRCRAVLRGFVVRRASLIINMVAASLRYTGRPARSASPLFNQQPAEGAAVGGWWAVARRPASSIRPNPITQSSRVWLTISMIVGTPRPSSRPSAPGLAILDLAPRRFRAVSPSLSLSR